MNFKIDNKRSIILTTGIVALVLAVFGVTYAWFSVNVINPEGSSINIETVDLGRVIFTDGPEINLSDMYPGTTETKEFTIERIGTVSSSEIFYTITLYVRSNTLTAVAEGEFICSLDGSKTGTGTTVSVSDIYVPETTYSLGTGSFLGDGVHTYIFEMTLNETGSNQNPTRGKGFNGYLQVEVLNASGE